MKFRQDFVTNSSSSSFIVSFEELPKTPLELKEWMFGNQENLKEYSTIKIATVVFSDIQTFIKEHKGFMKAKDMIVEIDWEEWQQKQTDAYNATGIFPTPLETHYDAYDFIRTIEDEVKRRDIKKKLDKVDSLFYKKERSAEKELQKIEFEKIAQFKNVLLSYGDNDGQFFATMENGNIFRNLRHIEISNH